MSNTCDSYSESSQIQEPIDIVVLWVDGNDPKWLAEKAKYQEIKTTDANAVNRFRDWGLMKYWFRAIENYAPWVRTIHFVTWGHTPAFLKKDHPKLHIVRHEDYLPRENLPLFNACAIEMSIHKIAGLAERFIFFNDDMFLLRPVSQEDFFSNGLPVARGNEKIEPPIGKLMAWYGMYCNDLGLINKHFEKKKAVKRFRKKYIHKTYGLKNNIKTFLLEQMYKGKFVGFEFPHSPAAYCKQSFEAIWNAEPELMRQTTANRFRTCYDVNQWAVLWWQIASGQFSPGQVDIACFDANMWATDMICQTIQKQSHDMLCINDPDESIDFETITQRIQAAFESILPVKSSFEK